LKCKAGGPWNWGQTTHKAVKIKAITTVKAHPNRLHLRDIVGLQALIVRARMLPKKKKQPA
jgi:hypothetical protein